MSQAPSLSAAIDANDLEAVRAALDAGADLDWAMRLALAYAFDHGVGGLVLLVERGASPHVRDDDFATTPLMHLAGAGELAAVQALLDRGANVADQDHDGATALDWALDGGCWRVAVRLVEAGAPYRGAAPEPGAPEGPYRAAPPDLDALARRCLLGAAAGGRLDDLQAILAAAPTLARDPAAMPEAWSRAAVAVIESRDDRRESCDARRAALDLLEQRAAAPPWEGADRRRILATRPVAAPLEQIRHIVGRLAPLREQERVVLIEAAADNGRADVLAWFLPEAAARPDELGGALIIAVCRGLGTPSGRSGEDAVATARLLLDAGAPVDARDLAGMTPLMHAANSRDLPMLELLLARGADVAARADDGRTAMAWASHLPDWPSEHRVGETIALLRRHGAADEPWKDDPAVTPPRPALTTADKIRSGLLLAIVGLALVLFAVRCVDAW